MLKRLRDLTKDEYDEWFIEKCLKLENLKCELCPFRLVYCRSDDPDVWIEHKDLYSDKFLNQEINLVNQTDKIINKLI